MLVLEESELLQFRALIALVFCFFPAHFDQLFARFFETEAIATLTMIVSQYKITIMEEPQFSGETFEQRKTRVLKCWNGLTLT